MTDALDNLIKAAKAVARHEQAYRQCARPERWPIMMPVGELLDLSDAVAAMEAAPAAVPALGEVQLHPDTAKLVDEFMVALAEKLHRAEVKYGYRDGWLTQDWQIECGEHLIEHLFKGDPIDVAAYCAFMWKRGWPTTMAALSSHAAAVWHGHDSALRHPQAPASGEGKLRGALEQLEQKAEAFRAATIENGILIRSAQNLYIDELRALEGAIADARHTLSATALTMV